MPQAPPSTPVQSLDQVRTAMLKASPSVSITWAEAVRDGLIDACGALKVAAIEMQIDPSQLSRDLQSGAFAMKRLDRLDPVKRALVAKRLHDAFGVLDTPRVRLRSLFSRIREDVSEVEQIVDGLIEERRTA